MINRKAQPGPYLPRARTSSRPSHPTKDAVCVRRHARVTQETTSKRDQVVYSVPTHPQCQLAESSAVASRAGPPLGHVVDDDARVVGPAFVAAVAAAVAIGGHAGPIADGADRVVVRYKAAAGTDPAVVRHSMMLSRASRVKCASASLLLANILLEEVAPPKNLARRNCLAGDAYSVLELTVAGLGQV